MRHTVNVRLRNALRSHLIKSSVSAHAVAARLGVVALVLACLLSVFVPCPLQAQNITLAPVISTVAGNGTAGYSGDNGPATSASLAYPLGVAADSAGNLYIASNQRIRKVDTSGTITTVAGNGTAGYSGDNGPATSAELNNPYRVAVDSAGNLYIADISNQRIRKVDTNGTITTVAGNGTAGYSGDNGPATSAELNAPAGVVPDTAGNLYIADELNRRIRKVDTNGVITTVAGNGTGGYNGDNIPATSAELLNPISVAVDSAGNLYIADSSNFRIRKVDTNGTITTVAGNGTGGYNGDNIPATSAEFFPLGVAVDSAGNLYIGDQSSHRIRKVDTSGTITTVAGNGTGGYNGDNIPATSAELFNPISVAVDSAGSLYIPDEYNQRIRKVVNGPVNFGPVNVGTSSTKNVFLSINAPLTLTSLQTSGDYSILSNSCALNTVLSANICTLQVRFTPSKPGQRWFPLLAGYFISCTHCGQSIFQLETFGLEGTGVGSALAFTPGIINTVAGNGTAGYSGDNGPATSAELYLESVAVDSAGNRYIADQANGRIRKVDTNGIITTVAGNGVPGYSGDNGPATSASLYYPLGVAVDSAGSLYIADEYNHRIRKVDASGTITTVAGNGVQGYNGDNIPATSAELLNPISVAVDSAGNLYIADSSNFRIRKVDTSGTITTVAGNGVQGYSGDNGPATSAEINIPLGVAVDTAGSLYIADFYNRRIRKVDASGTITTVAGNGTVGYNGDNIPATTAKLDGPYGVAVDSAGSLYIADEYNHRIRKVDASGTITTVAGSGTAGYNGDNIPAISAEINNPNGVAVDSAGNLYIADQSNWRIRKVDVTTSALSFSSQNVGETSSAQSVAVSDVGNAPLGFSSLVASSSFLLQGVGNDCVAGTPLAVGATCNLGVAFSPAAPGNPLMGSVTVADDAFNSPQMVSLSGTAMNPVVPRVSLSATSLSFGNWGVSVTSPAFSSTLTNTGNATLALTSILVSGDFALVTTGSSCPYAGGSVNAGASCTIDATFSPTTTGSRSGAMTITDNAADSPQTVSLSGTGISTTTTTTLSSSLNPSFVGQSVTLTATVSGSTPTGSVSFNDGSTLLAAFPLTGNQASYSTSSLAVGSHSITATYSGDALNAGSTSTTLGQVVNPYVPVTWTVTSLADDNSPGTLRYQIATGHSGDTINLNASGTIVLTQGQLEISKDLTISGPGASSLTISGNNISRIFQIDSGITASITGVTVEQGAGGINGRDILNNGTLAVSDCAFLVNTYNSDAGTGGGLFNAGTATVTNCSFVGSVDFGVAGDGGGIYNAGDLTVVGSTFSNFGVGGAGGAIFNAGYFQSAAGTGTVINSTFFQNRANEGAAIFDAGTATAIAVVNSTFSGNAGNSVVYTLYGGTTLKNTLIANSGGNNCGAANGAIKSGGYNLSDDKSCSGHFTQASDLNNTPAGLDPNGLKNNGGPTATVGLLPSSPALDAIPLSACTYTSGQMITADQRGIARPQGTACDIGAFERAPGASTTVSMSSSANPSGVNQLVTFTATVTPVSGTSTPTGSVVFMDGSTTLATLPLSSSAQATYATSSLAVGAHNITVSYSGDVQFNGSTSTTYSQVVNLLSTAITIAAPAVPYGSTANVSVSVSSGQDTVTGNVSLTVDSGSPLTQALSNGSTIFNISGLAVGNHSLSASYAAQGNFDASSSTGTLQVNQAQLTISIGNIPTSAAYGGSFTPTYSYNGDGATSVASSTTGTCAVSSAVVNFVGAGTCTLIAHATAGTNYSAATGNPQSFSIAKVTTTISINNIPSAAKYGGSFAPTYAYAGDGTPSITSSTITTCTVFGNVVNLVGAGLCTLTAHATAGNNYAAANGNPQSFTIAQAIPTISINNIPTSAKYGNNFTPTYAYIGDGATSVTSNTSGTCTVSGSVVNFVAVGTCTLTAHGAATANSVAATGSPQSFSIGQATPTINISNLPGNAAYGGLFTPTYAYAGNGKTSTTSNTLSTCTVSGMGVANFVGTGTCTLIAHATATVNYAAATGSPQSFTIAQAITTISIKNIPNNPKRGGSFTPTYNYIGDGTPSTTSSTPAICTVSGSLVNFLSFGTCRLTALATAGSHYAATTGSPQSFTIK